MNFGNLYDSFQQKAVENSEQIVLRSNAEFMEAFNFLTSYFFSRAETGEYKNRIVDQNSGFLMRVNEHDDSICFMCDSLVMPRAQIDQLKYFYTLEKYYRDDLEEQDKFLTLTKHYCDVMKHHLELELYVTDKKQAVFFGPCNSGINALAMIAELACTNIELIEKFDEINFIIADPINITLEVYDRIQEGFSKIKNTKIKIIFIFMGEDYLNETNELSGIGTAGSINPICLFNQKSILAPYTIYCPVYYDLDKLDAERDYVNLIYLHSVTCLLIEREKEAISFVPTLYESLDPKIKKHLNAINPKKPIDYKYRYAPTIDESGIFGFVQHNCVYAISYGVHKPFCFLDQHLRNVLKQDAKKHNLDVEKYAKQIEVSLEKLYMLTPYFLSDADKQQLRVNLKKFFQG